MLSVNEQILLEAIAADRESDTPRLVYADWLSQPNCAADPAAIARAELIRVECRLAQLHPELPEARCLAKRSRQLLSRFRDLWLGPLAEARIVPQRPPHHRGITQLDFSFRRGFVEEVSCRGAEKLTETGEIWLAKTPTLDSLRFTESSSEDLHLLSRWPGLTHLRGLSLSLQEGRYARRLPRELCRLLGSLDPVQLKRLEIRAGESSGLAILRALESVRLPRLRTLSLRRIHPDCVEMEQVLVELASEGFLTEADELEELDLSGNNFGKRGYRALANWTLAGRLRRLNLSMTHAGKRSISFLRQSPLLVGLQALSLAGNAWNHRIASELANLSELASLEVLDLSRQYLCDAGAVALAAPNVLGRLKVLNLASNQIGDRGAMALLDSPNLANIQRLDLSHNPTITRSVRLALVERFGQKVTA